MKMVMVVYNEAVDMEVMEVLENCRLQNYTKVKGVYGKGVSSGTHFGTDIWPGRNNILYVACSKDEAEKLFSCVHELRKKLAKEGVKAFVWDLQDVT